MGQPVRRLMGQLMRRSMNQPISDIHVRCGIGWIRGSLLNETKQWLLNNRANHLFKVASVCNQGLPLDGLAWSCDPRSVYRFYSSDSLMNSTSFNQ
jgi:hypothetical protein